MSDRLTYYAPPGTTRGARAHGPITTLIEDGSCWPIVGCEPFDPRDRPQRMICGLPWAMLNDVKDLLEKAGLEEGLQQPSPRTSGVERAFVG